MAGNQVLNGCLGPSRSLLPRDTSCHVVVSREKMTGRGSQRGTVSGATDWRRQTEEATVKGTEDRDWVLVMSLRVRDVSSQKAGAR